jgi:hypothetical protein
MADDGAARSRQHGLQQAASLIFALVAIVPLLIFAWTLHSLGAIRSTQAQLSLGLALGVALLGFWIFRSMLGRMAAVVQALVAAVEQAQRQRLSLAPTPATPSVATLRGGVRGATPPGSEGEASPATVRRAPMAPASRSAAATRPASQEQEVAGLGSIRELTEVVQAMDALWHREASAHLGCRVRVSVANSRDPLVGVLGEATGDGLILEQADGAVAVAYSRVTAIDRLP